MSKECFLLIEYLETITTAYIINKVGKVVASGSQYLSTVPSLFGPAELDPLEVVFSVRAAINKAFHASTFGEDSIAGIGVLTPGKGCLAWSKHTGNPLCSIFSADGSFKSFSLTKLEKLKIDEDIYRRTGRMPDATYSAFKWSYLVQKSAKIQEGLAEGTVNFGTVDSWIIYNLTGRKSHVTDYTHAASTLLFNIETLSWDEFLLNEFQLPVGSLPDVTSSMSMFGVTSGFVSLPDGIPILALSTTTGTELLGLGGYKFGDGYLHFDSNGRFLLNTGQELSSLSDGKDRVILPGYKEVRYGLDASLDFPTQLGEVFNREDGVLSDFLKAGQLAGNVSDTKGVYMVPEPKKGFEPDGRRVILFGLCGRVSNAHLARAFFESMAFSVKAFLDRLEETSQYYPRELKVCGPFSGNDFLMQFQADILQIPLARFSVDHARLYGMAYMMGLQTNCFDSPKVVEEWVDIDTQFVPSMDPITSHSKYNHWLECAMKVYG